ncbi:hypothetical protein B0H14DRAFT_3891011 [Mycena olivaceomarginata]|nr:hypothetical protein B0H14DRAFT_3891011 [Mycena olivaceomarginata]
MSDPVALAAQALAWAMADAQHAESEVLQAKNATLVASSRTQLQEINFLRMRCDALAADCELARDEISTRDRKIPEITRRWNRKRFRLRVVVAREEAVIAERDCLGRERATLSKDRDLTQIAQQERPEQPPGIRNAGGPRRYRNPVLEAVVYGIKASKDERDFRNKRRGGLIWKHTEWGLETESRLKNK